MRILISSILVALILGPFVVEQLVGPTKDLVIKEGGIIETLSAIGYFLCLAVLLIKGGFSLLIHKWYFHVVLLLLGFRELDFDKRFTMMGILKSRFYLSPEVPLYQKMIGVSVIVLVLIILYKITKNHLHTLFSGLKSRELLPLCVSIAIFLIVISKSIDGLPRKMASFGVSISDRASSFAGSIEEIFEFGIPVFFLIALWAYFGQNDRHKHINLN